MSNGLLKRIKALFFKRHESHEINYEDFAKSITWHEVLEDCEFNKHSEVLRLNENSKSMNLNEESDDSAANRLTSKHYGETEELYNNYKNLLPDNIASDTHITNDNLLLKAIQEENEQKRGIAYEQIEKQFVQDKSRIDKIARSADCSLDQAFLFWLFHHAGTRRLDEENFCLALMEFLGDKKMVEFKSIQDIKSFINEKTLFLGNVDFLESIDDHIIGMSRVERSFDNGDLSIFNNVYLFNHLTIDDFKHILNNEEPNPIHDVQVRFVNNYYRIYFYQYTEIVLRIRVKNEEQKDSIIRNIKEFDEVSKSNRHKDYLLLEKKISGLENNLTLLFNNLVSEIPRGYLLYPESRRIIEHTILSNAYLRDILFESPLFFPRNYIYSFIFDQPKEDIAYLRGIFEKLKKILTNKVDIDIYLIPAFIWMALRNQVIIYFANEWNEKFGIYFKSIDGDYRDFIKAYCEIQEINILDAENIGLLTNFLMNEKVLPIEEDRDCYYRQYYFVKKEIELLNETIALEKFENKLMRKPNIKKMKFNDIDLFTGYEFEEFVEKLFTKMGYLSTRTKGSGDQGIDVLAEKDGRKFGYKQNVMVQKLAIRLYKRLLRG